MDQLLQILFCKSFMKSNLWKPRSLKFFHNQEWQDNVQFIRKPPSTKDNISFAFEFGESKQEGPIGATQNDVVSNRIIFSYLRK